MIPTIIMPGVYTVRVMDVRPRISAITGERRPAYAVKMRTASGHELWDWFANTPSTAWKWQNFGITSWSDLGSIEGHYYLVAVKLETFPQQGQPDKLTNRISEYLAEVNFHSPTT